MPPGPLTGSPQVPPPPVPSTRSGESCGTGKVGVPSQGEAFGDLSDHTIPFAGRLAQVKEHQDSLPSRGPRPHGSATTSGPSGEGADAVPYTAGAPSKPPEPPTEGPPLDGAPSHAPAGHAPATGTSRHDSPGPPPDSQDPPRGPVDDGELPSLKKTKRSKKSGRTRRKLRASKAKEGPPPTPLGLDGPGPSDPLPVPASTSRADSQAPRPGDPPTAREGSNDSLTSRAVATAGLVDSSSPSHQTVSALPGPATSRSDSPASLQAYTTVYVGPDPEEDDSLPSHPHPVTATEGPSQTSAVLPSALSDFIVGQSGHGELSLRDRVSEAMANLRHRTQGHTTREEVDQELALQPPVTPPLPSPSDSPSSGDFSDPEPRDHSPLGARLSGLSAQRVPLEDLQSTLSVPQTDDPVWRLKEARVSYPLQRPQTGGLIQESALSRDSLCRKSEDAGHAQAVSAPRDLQATSLDLSAQSPAPLTRSSVKRRLSLSSSPTRAPSPKRREQDLLQVLQDSLRSLQSSLVEQLDTKVEALRKEFSAAEPPAAQPPSTSQAAKPEPPQVSRVTLSPPVSSATLPVYYDEDEIRLPAELAQQRLTAWNDAAMAVSEVCPSSMPGGPVSSPTKSFHFEDPAMGDRASNPKRLPLHPSLIAGFEGLAISVACPDSKSAHTRLSGAPLPPGRFLEPQRKFPDRYCRPSGAQAGFTKPAKVNHDLDRLTQSQPAAVNAKAEKTLQAQESSLREIVALHSVGKWQREAVYNIAAKLKAGSSPEPLHAALDLILPQMQSTDARLEDRLCTNLANVVLQRRDLHIASLKGFKEPAAVAQLRSSSFLSEGLFGNALPEKLLKEAEEQRAQARMLQASRQSLVIHTVTQPAPKPKPSAAQGKAQTNQPFRAASPTPSAGRGAGSPPFAGRGGGKAPGRNAQNPQDKNPKRAQGSSSKRKGKAPRKRVD